MKLPAALKSKIQSKKQSSSKDDIGRLCIIHFPGTVDVKVTPLTEQNFCKIKETAAERLKISDEKQKLAEISSRLPDKFDLTVQGYHRRCYQLFTILPHASKQKATSCTVADDKLPSTSERSRPSSAASSASSTVLFPVDKCLFCMKRTSFMSKE